MSDLNSERDRLINEKLSVDARLAKLKAQLIMAKGEAATKRKFMQPEQYAKLTLEVSALSQKSQSLQYAIGKNSRSSRGINDYFREAAKEILSKDDYVRVLDLAEHNKTMRVPPADWGDK